MIGITKDSENILKLRHYQNTLEVLGRGVLLFALWSVLKLTMYFFLDEKAIAFYQDQMLETGFTRTQYIIIMYIILAIDLVIRFLVSKAAVSEAKGKARGYFYLVVCVGMIGMSVLSIVSIFEGANDIYSDIFTYVVSLIIEITVMAILIGVIVYSILIKRIRKTSGEEAEK